MHLLRPVEITRPLRAAVEARVLCQLGPGRGAHEQAQENVHTAIVGLWMDSGRALADYSAAVQKHLGRDVIEAYREAVHKQLIASMANLRTLEKNGRGIVRDFAEDTIKPALETLEGVASIEIVGGRERQVNVLLDLDRIQALGLTPLSVVERIRNENLSVPGGKTGQWFVTSGLISMVGFTCWPHLFMKAFSARDDRTLRRSATRSLAKGLKRSGSMRNSGRPRRMAASEKPWLLPSNASTRPWYCGSHMAAIEVGACFTCLRS